MRSLLAAIFVFCSVAGANAQALSVSPTGGTPGGASLTVQYNNAGVFGGMTGTSWDNTNRSLTITGTTVTASKPILNLSQTWNNATEVFKGATLNITNTASAAGSKAFEIMVGTDSFFSVDASSITRALTFNASVAIQAPVYYFNSSSTTIVSSPAAAKFSFGGDDLVTPIAQTVGASNVLTGTSNTAGALLTYNGSAGTGTGVGGNIKFQLALASGSGSTQNSFTDALTLDASGAVPRIAAGGPIKRKGYTVATLPTGSEGDEAYVTDQLTACPVLGGTFTGGGVVKCSAFFDGSAWTHQ